MNAQRTSEFFRFHNEVKGHKFFKGESEIPIYILFWKGYDAEQLIFNRTNIKAVPSWMI